MNASENALNIKEEPSSTSSSSSNCPSLNVSIKEEVVIKKEKDDDHFRDEDNSDIREKGKSDAEIIRDLKSQLKYFIYLFIFSVSLNDMSLKIYCVTPKLCI